MDTSIEEYIKELKEILELIKTNEELLSVVKHPEITTSQKKRVFKSIFKGKVDDYILGFLLILIEKDRILYLEEKLNEMEKIHLERKNILVANVKSVIPLNEDEKSTLIGKLKKMYGKNIILKEKIDKSIIGGLYIRVGDDVIDGTIKTKFEEIRRRVIHS